ncbi:MAG: FAD-binding oxidoreductase, partial [Dehalococcoidia bacterium]
MATEPIQGQADVVIIGGGIIGCATAYYLAKRGADVVVVEKGELSDEQSGRNWGWIRQQGRNPREIPLVMLSIRLWSQLAGELTSDIEWLQSGSLRLGYDEEEMAHLEAWTKGAQEAGLDTSVLSAAEVKSLIPALEGPYRGGAYTPTDGQAEPRTATIAVATAARECGAKIYTHCAAEGLEVANGAVTEVVTERGAIRAPVVVCAAGAWSGKVGRMVGLDLPQRVV